jgi:hypothetical protein
MLDPASGAEYMAIEFVVQPKDFTQALRFIRPVGRQAVKEFVDVTARKSEVEFASTSATSAFPAQVVSPGHAKAPVWVFEWFRKTVKTLKQPSIRVSIVDGQVKAENLTYSHPDITVRAHRRAKYGG